MRGRGIDRPLQRLDRRIELAAMCAPREQAIQFAREPRPIGVTRQRELVAQFEQRSVDGLRQTSKKFDGKNGAKDHEKGSSGP